MWMFIITVFEIISIAWHQFQILHRKVFELIFKGFYCHCQFLYQKKLWINMTSSLCSHYWGLQSILGSDGKLASMEKIITTTTSARGLDPLENRVDWLQLNGAGVSNEMILSFKPSRITSIKIGSWFIYVDVGGSSCNPYILLKWMLA